MVYILLFLLLLAIALTTYFCCNKGMARNARGQQTRRLTAAAMVSVLPMALAGQNLLQPAVVIMVVVAVAWMITYPLLFHLTNRKSSPDYENYMDTDFGLYLLGGLSGAYTLVAAFWPDSTAVGVMVGVVETALLALPLFQTVYYITYKTCIDATGMGTVTDTNSNEIIEFFRSFAWWQVLLAALAFVVPAAVVIGVNACWPMGDAFGLNGGTAAQVLKIVVLALTLFLLYYTWKPHHGVFVRTGLIMLFNNVREHNRNFLRYKEKNAERMSRLEVKPLGKPIDRPKTIILVIGESACRDFMSAYNPDMAEDTTPWLKAASADMRHFYFFHNAYSCAMQTVPALTRALTECNQYNDKEFYDSCSFIDIAHKLGYQVHWYSNQGHLGAGETPITIIADTAEVDKWTQQEVGKVQYDETLLDFYKEIDPTVDNLIVFHLKGSHFNFQNRYPRDFTLWGDPDVADNVTYYKNSIAYTDMVLQKIYDYARQKLNLQAMVYCSDHATEPGRRRKPNFDGFQMTRIPLFVYLADSYISSHPGRAAALDRNRQKYWTNDLLYELLCGVMDVSSPNFIEANSLASDQYRWKREDLLTYEGRKHISEDNGQ